jgi:subtilisin family serine protease
VWDLGFQGQGEVIPIVDTGVNPDSLPAGAVQQHVDLTEDRDSHDYEGHGTLMARLILGMAPKARLVSVKALGKSAVTDRKGILRALDFSSALSPRPKFINLSLAVPRSHLGLKDCTLKKPCVLCKRVNELWEAGIVTVAAAGNFSSGADSFTCPAAARWSVKVRDLGKSGTSHAAAMHTGFLAVLASAFPQKPAPNIVAVLNHTGVRLLERGTVVVPDLASKSSLGGTSMPNVYRAFVFLQQAIAKPSLMNPEQSYAITCQAAKLLRGTFDPQEVMTMMEQALDLDESNYLAYLLYSAAVDALGMHDKAEELLMKCNDLLPPGEALTRLEIFGGRGGGNYNPKSGS